MNKHASGKRAQAATNQRTAEAGNGAYIIDKRSETAQPQDFQQMANTGPQAQQAAQLQAMAGEFVQRKQADGGAGGQQTSLPDTLKAGIENLSGQSMHDVKVHYNSAKPAQLQAHAYAKGPEIHLGPGQEKHLPHEAWHVAQQKQGRVKPTTQLKGKVAINDDAALEKEADVMGAKALAVGKALPPTDNQQLPVQRAIAPTVQRVAYAQANTRYNELMQEEARLDVLEQTGQKLEDDYYDAEEAKAKEVAVDAIKAFWTTNIQAPIPADFDEVISEWQDKLKAPLAPILNDLRTVTNLPPPLANDTVRLEVGRNISHLKAILASKGFEQTAAGYVQYVDAKLAYFATVKELFLDETEVLEQFWDGDQDALRITFQSLGADEHGYAPPTKLDFTDGHTDASVVFKDRPGRADKLVTDLFAELNDKFDLAGTLPAYRQEVFGDGQLVSEFVAGRGMDQLIALMSGAATQVDWVQPEIDRPQTQANLRILEAVSKAIGLTDLHEENLIHHAGTQQVIPIDLEAFTTGLPMETGLYGQAEAPDLSALIPEGAVPLIAKFKEDLDLVERRWVPVPTGQLYNTLSTDGVATTVGLIAPAMEANDFEVNKANLAAYVKACHEHAPMAVPAFTLLEGTVWSSPIDGKKLEIARCKYTDGRQATTRVAFNAAISPLVLHYTRDIERARSLEGRDENPHRQMIVQLFKPHTGTLAEIARNARSVDYLREAAKLASYEDSLAIYTEQASEAKDEWAFFLRQLLPQLRQIISSFADR